MIVKRGIAYIIDFSMALVPFYIYFQLFKHKNPDGEFVVKGGTGIPFFWLTYSFYFIFQEYKWHRTIGKRIFRLKVVKTDNSKLSLPDVLKRHLFDFVEMILIPVLPVIIASLNDKNQRLGDLIAKTQIVRDHP